MRSVSCVALALTALGLGRGQASAESDHRMDRLEIPDFTPDPVERPHVLPPVPPSILEGADPIATDRVLRSIRITGNEEIATEVLEALVAPFRGRAVSWSDLERIQGLLTRRYLADGYVNSGALLPTIADDGALLVTIVEGRVGQVLVEGRGRLPKFFVEQSIVRPFDGALNLVELEDRIRVLRRDPRIEDASLHVRATDQRGVADLRVEIAPAPPVYAELEASNRLSPTQGAENGLLVAGHRNLFGITDHLEVAGRASDGLRELIVRYDLPISPLRTRLVVGGRVLAADVVESEFRALDLESEQQEVWARIEQPLFESVRHRHAVSLEFGWKRSLSTVFGGERLDVVFGPLEDPRAVAGNNEAFLLRARHDYAFRGRSVALAISNTLTRGIDVPGTTALNPGVVDSEFLVWLGQLSAAFRLPLLDSRLAARTDVQLASSRVVGFEQFSVGGFYSVRGYRENTLVRDNGLLMSIEWQVPLPVPSTSRLETSIFSFYDVARSWDRATQDEPFEWIHSAGVGLRVDAARIVSAEIAWAHRFQSARDGLDGDLQDRGVHFRVAVRWP